MELELFVPGSIETAALRLACHGRGLFRIREAFSVDASTAGVPAVNSPPASDDVDGDDDDGDGDDDGDDGDDGDDDDDDGDDVTWASSPS